MSLGWGTSVPQPTDASSEEPEIELTLPEESSEDEDQGIDPALLEVFSGELATHVGVVQDFIDHAQQEDYQTPISDELQRALSYIEGQCAHGTHRAHC